MSIIRVCDRHPRRRARVTLRYIDADKGVRFDRDLCGSCELDEMSSADYRADLWYDTGRTEEGTVLREREPLT
jgi:hypothetical protein